MTNAQDQIRVLAISSNELMLDLIKTSLDKERNYFFIEYQKLDGNLMEGIEQSQPNCILLDYLYQAGNPLDLIDSISLQFPEIIVVIILPQEKITEANRAILAGARAFMVQPFEQKDLLDTLRRIKELYKRSHQGKTDASTDLLMETRGTFSVFSPKGGTGCSTIAINLAVALREELKQEVLLMDGKLFFGDLDIMLNLKTLNSITELIPHIGALDEGLLHDVISEHPTGIKVLPAPLNPIAAQGIHPEELHRIVTAAQNTYQNIVIDSGNYLNENTVTLMDASHKILLVINPEIASLRDASRFIEICYTTLTIPKEKILLIVNQYDQRDGISINDIERTLQMKVFAALPWDPRVPLQSINRGVPIFTQGPKIPLRKSFETMAKNTAALIGYGKTEAPSKTTKGIPDVLSKSSHLG
jgi:pilus assembly protein CpaE